MRECRVYISESGMMPRWTLVMNEGTDLVVMVVSECKDIDADSAEEKWKEMYSDGKAEIRKLRDNWWG